MWPTSSSPRKSASRNSEPPRVNINERWLLAASWQPPPAGCPNQRPSGANRDRTGDLLNAITESHTQQNPCFHGSIETVERPADEIVGSLRGAFGSQRSVQRRTPGGVSEEGRTKQG